MVDLRESSFYQLVHDEGGIAASRRTILSLGQRQFGAATPRIVAKLESIVDQAKLEAIIDRILDVSSWEDLLAGN